MKYLVLLFVPLLAFSRARKEPPFDHYAALGQITGYVTQRKFGLNPDIDSTSVPEDITVIGGEYAFPTSAQLTTVSSTDATDDFGSTGCNTLQVRGLDADYAEVIENAAMDGTNSVSLSTLFFRITSASCILSGSNEGNAGDISIYHGAAVIGKIVAGEGGTEQVVYTVPAGKYWYIDSFGCALEKKGTGSMVIDSQIKLFGTNTWRTIHSFGLDAAGTSAVDNSPKGNRPFVIPPKTDVRVRAVYASSNDNQVTCNVAGYLVDPTKLP
jgi:hypothetical protein